MAQIIIFIKMNRSSRVLSTEYEYYDGSKRYVTTEPGYAKRVAGCSGVEGEINIYLFKFAGNGKCTRMFRIKCLSGWVDGPPHHASSSS